jgi:hypothetical protein
MRKRWPWMLAVLLPLFIPISSFSQIQNYDLTWWTIDNGGGTSTGGNYILSGTLGQPDAGVLSGGTYSLIGGFWAIDAQRFIYLPLIFKN